MVSDYRTKKRFGQHFLHDQQVIAQIMQAADLRPTDPAVEIGPGLGVLTERLLETAATVDVFEIDRDLIERLQARRESRLTVHAGDVLRMNLAEELTAPPYTLVANLPYNISSQVVFQLIEHRGLFRKMVLMFQKEVGDRLCAEPGGKDYGILSVLSQLWFDILPVVKVRPGAFNPPPKVDSLVLCFVPLAAPRVDPVDPQFFVRVVKAAFTQRRKQLRNSLKAGGFNLDQINRALALADIDPSRRGESLDLGDFSLLTRALLDSGACA